MSDRSTQLEKHLNDSSDLSSGQKEQLKRLATFRPTAIGDSRFGVLTMPEVDAGMKPIYFDVVGGERSLEGLQWFWDFGLADPPVEFRYFSEDERQRLSFAHEKLRLPSLVAIHLVMNKGLTEEEMERTYGRSFDDVPGLLSLGKFSMQGKTILAAELRRGRFEVVNLDEFSTENLDSYWKLLGDDPGSLTTEEVVEKILAGLGKEKGQREENWTMEKALDRLAKVFESGRRPEMVICDMPGYRLPGEGEEERMINIFDLVAEDSMAMIGLMRIEDGEIQRESRIDWRVIEDYVEQINETWTLYCQLAQLKERMFGHLLGNNLDQMGGLFDLWLGCWEAVREVAEGEG